MTTTTTQRRALEALRTELDTVLGAVRDTNPGLTIEVGRCTFSPAGAFTFKLTGVLPGGQSRETQAYDRLRNVMAMPTITRNARGEELSRHPGLDLPPLGTKFLHRGHEYTVTGATPRGKVITKRDGKTYTWAAGSMVHVIKVRP
jgi:hypothetical protein